MTTEEILERLPDSIVKPNPEPIDEWDDKDYYCFCLTKDEDTYDLSYTCWLKEKDLVSFKGSLSEVASKMYEWYNKHK